MATSPFTASSRAVMNVPLERNANLNSSEIKQELAELDRAKTKAEDALRLWLRWNAIHEKLSTAMFDQRHDQQKVEQLMDESDSLRRQAIQAALECLLGT